jgi:HEAT repeat protein
MDDRPWTVEYNLLSTVFVIIIHMSFLKNFFKPKLTWEQAIRNLTDFEAAEPTQFIKAFEAIDKLADSSKIPELYRLLNHHEYIVREAAAIPLARLEGVKSLSLLLEALVRGEEDGHDNDGLVETIAELLESHKGESVDALMGVFQNGDHKIRSGAAWAFGFVVPEITSDFLLECFLTEKDEKVRAALVGSMDSFKSNQKVINVLLQNVHDENEQVRVSVIFTLAQIGDRDVVQKLKSFLETETDNVRRLTEYAVRQAEGLI